MNSYESYSTFGTLIGMGIGSLIPGGWLIGGALGGMLGSIFGSGEAAEEQKKQQKKLEQAQINQNKLLHEKIKSDTAELYSSVSSAVNQTSGAMGAIY